MIYKYKYNGKEYQGEFGLNTTAMDYRQYDNALGRFNCIDPLAELDFSVSPYAFGNNDPVYFSDPSGLKAEGGWLDWIKNLFGGGSDEGTVNSVPNPLNEVVVQGYKKPQSNTSSQWWYSSMMSNYMQPQNLSLDIGLGGGGRGGVRAGGINFAPSIYHISALTTLAEINASKNIKALEKSGEYWLKLTGKYAGRTTKALQAEKFTKVLMESASKKLFVVGLAVSVASVANDHSASNVAINVLDTAVGVMGFIPGMQIPVLIYMSARIGYDMYNAYNNE